MPSESPLPLEDVLAFFLKDLPFLALPGPPHHLALPGPRGHAPLARVESVVARAPAASTLPPAAAAAHPHAAHPPTSTPRSTTPDGFPAPPPLAPLHGMAPGAATPTGEDEGELAPSPWDPGFEPPKSAVGTDPNDLGPDPRMLSLNRPRRGGTVPGMRAVSAPAKKKPGPPVDPTHDFVIVPQNPTFRTAEQGVNAVLTYLRTAQFFGLRARRDLPDETVFELAPETFVHQIFGEGAAPDGPPSVLEATLRVSAKPRPVPFGPAGRTSCLCLTLVGCRFAKVGEPFKARLHQIVYMRPEIFPLPHDPARLRTTAGSAPASIPAFEVQEVDRG
ncbi:MAG: hypothetical protein IT385_23265 [Deltaproteobacteria bacterium]|nr:hypothetical protein [Deltaproteobacteria bacterium]